MKAYLVGAVLILMSITSLGIYGFLARSNTDSNLINQELALRVTQIHDQRENLQKMADRYQSQLTQLDTSINIKLQNNRTFDADATRRSQGPERADIKSKLDAVSDTMAKMGDQETDLKSKLQVAESGSGPIKYIAELFSGGEKADVDATVRKMIILLVIVFDPLAMASIIAANMTLVKKPEEDIITINSPATSQITPVFDHAAMADTMREFGTSMSLNMASTMGNAIAELSKTMVAIQPVPASLQPSSVNHEPTVGQMVWNDDQGAMMKWDGSQWTPVLLNIPQQSSTASFMDTVTVQKVVQDSMDAWLSQALGAEKPKVEPVVENIIEEPFVKEE
jgi:hypothetical protein